MYVYEEQKPKLFTDEGQRQFIKVRDHVHQLLKSAGAVRMQEAIRPITGDCWTSMAYVDRLVELGEIRELELADVWGQYRVFVAAK